MKSDLSPQQRAERYADGFAPRSISSLSDSGVSLSGSAPSLSDTDRIHAEQAAEARITAARDQSYREGYADAIADAMTFLQSLRVTMSSPRDMADLLGGLRRGKRCE